jgi:hypothetical protein
MPVETRWLRNSPTDASLDDREVIGKDGSRSTLQSQMGGEMRETRGCLAAAIAVCVALSAPSLTNAAQDASAKAKEVEDYILAKYEREQYYLKGMKNLDEFIAFMEAKYQKAYRGGPQGSQAMWLFRPAADPVGNCAFVKVYPKDDTHPGILMFDRVTIGKCAMFEQNETGRTAQ